MWSFPIVSAVFSFFFWKGEFSKKEIAILSIGLCLQGLSYFSAPIGPFLTSAAWVSLGKGLLLGVLYANFALKPYKIPEKHRESIRYKVIIFSGLLFLTLTTQVSTRFSEAFLTIGYLFLPAIFWTTRKKKELKVLFVIFLIAFLSFFSFFVQWAGVMRDLHGGIPLVWMISFCSCFFLAFRMKETVE